jgi:hypothetical protein
VTKVLKLFILLSTLPVSASAQDALGMSVGNYAGMEASLLNPAAMANSKSYLEVNLLSGNIFVQNNYLRLVPNEMNGNQNLTVASSIFPFGGGSGLNIVDNYTTPDKIAYSNIRFTGPSFIYSINRHAYAFHTSFRMFTSGLDIPYDVAKFAFEGLYFSPQHFINYIHPEPFKVMSLGWNELRFSYANTFRKNYREQLTAGVALKVLLGYHGAYMSSTHADYMVPHRDTIHIYHLDAVAGYSLPIDYNNNDFYGLRSPVRGFGLAFDIGLTYTKPSQESLRRPSYMRHDETPYIYRLGVSLIDVGYINFNKHSRRLLFDGISTTWGGLADIQFYNINALMDTMSLALSNNLNGLDDGTDFRMLLPAALSLQFDYNINGSFYVHAMLMQNIPMATLQVSRPSYVAVIPRFESDRFGVSVPVTYLGYDDLRLGLAFRYLYFTVGTDKLGAYYGSTDYDGFSFYFSIKFNLLKANFDKGGFECHRD